MTDSYTAMLITYARWAREHNDKNPKDTWSIANQLAVALVLDNYTWMENEELTVDQAKYFLMRDSGVSPADFSTWLEDVRQSVYSR